MAVIGGVGYAAVALLYALLSVLLLLNFRGTRIGIVLIAACLFSVMWGALLTLEIVESAPRTLIYGVEVLRAAGWLVLLSVLVARLGTSRWLIAAANLPWIVMLLLGFGLWAARQFVAFTYDLVSLLIPGGLIIALAGLILVEQLMRNSPADTRWRIKQLLFAVGGIFAYDLFMYSQGLLFGVIDEPIWHARGVVNALFVPLIAVAARKNPRWELNIFVSRQVVFYSTTLVAVGLYLIGMSIGGYLLLIYGGTWGGLAQIVFFVGAILVLVTLLFSSTLRARLKVFLSKHFFRNKYDYREEWLRLIATMTEYQDSATREIVIKALAQIVNSPSGMLWIRDEKGEHFQMITSYGRHADAPDIRNDDPLIAFIEDQRWLVDISEYRNYPERYGGLELPSWMDRSAAAWLVVPLFFGDELLAIVLLTRSSNPVALNYEDRDLLKTVGQHIGVHIAQERSDRLLVEAQQFQAYNRLTAFLMHDLNNLIAQQSLIVRNAKRHKTNPEFIDDAIETIANSVRRMRQVMEQLRTGKDEPTRKKTLLKFLVSAAADRCSSREPVPALRYNDDDVAVNVDAEQLTMVLTHLIQNAQDATPRDGSIVVTVQNSGGEARVVVSDSGSGMSAEFIRERLFRPFDSTKGSQGMGIGAYQAREFARKMGGDLLVRSELGEGTEMVLSLPAAG